MTRILALAFLLCLSPGAKAATFVLDDTTGTDYDSVGDGWFFTTPPNQPPDGVGDMGNQALAVAYKSGVLEMRAMAEFPLAPLAGLTASDIQSATVSVTIDDVLTTFGPGAEFEGTASSPIAVYHYPADGTVTVGDFSPAGLAQIGLVTPGAVTDASLAVSGALTFTVDATQKVKDALTAGNTAFGVLMGTLDTPTGTSLDNLSPPGVAGGAFPKLTVVTVPQTPPVLSIDAQACQKTLAKAATKLATTELQAFAKCFGLVLKDYAPDATLAPATTTKCAAQIDKGNVDSKLSKAIAKFASKVQGKCSALTPADIGSPCIPAAPSINATIECVRDQHVAAAESLIAGQYAGACNMLTAVGLDTIFPGVCAP